MPSPSSKVCTLPSASTNTILRFSMLPGTPAARGAIATRGSENGKAFGTLTCAEPATRSRR